MAVGYRYHNAYSGDGVIAHLDGAITNTALSLIVDALPTGLTGVAAEVPFAIQIDLEWLLVTSLGATPFLTWTVTRGHETTLPAAHLDNANIFYPLPAGALNELRDAHTPLELTAPSTLVPSQTGEGQMVWDSDSDHLTVGTGAGRKTLANTDDVISTTSDHNHTATAGQGGLLTADEHDSFSEYAEIAAPATPASGKVRFYAKADGHL
jgi:hypothetical protein